MNKMKIHILLMILLSAVFLLSAASPGTLPKSVEEVDVEAILEKFDDLWRGKSSRAKIVMNVKTKHWERSLTMDTWSLGKDRSLIKLLKPLKERGTATLKVGKEIYNYLPKTDKTIKLTSAMMMGSWMGSHFTNDDLVKESRMSDDYDTKASFVGKRDGMDVIELTSIPKPDAAVVWGKVATVFRAADRQPIKVLYYDEDGDPAREMILSGIKKVSGRVMPTVMKMVPTDKPKEYTEIIYKEISFGVSLKEGFFSLNRLRR